MPPDCDARDCTEEAVEVDNITNTKFCKKHWVAFCTLIRTESYSNEVSASVLCD